MEQSKDLVLLIGATGKCGYNTLKALTEKGYRVRIITRNRDKAKKTLGELFDKIEDIYVCDLCQEAKVLEKKIENGFTKSIIEFAFQPASDGQKVTHCIVATGAIRTSPPEPAKYIDYYANVLIINLCKKYEINNFFFITAMGMTKPYNLIVYILNMLVDCTYHWKSKSEVYLRKSGLDYCIIRPGRLLGNIQNSSLHGITISQGDTKMMDSKAHGTNVGTIGYLMVKCIEEKQNKNVTFEVTSSNDQVSDIIDAERFWKEPHFKGGLRKDDDNNLNEYNHIEARRNLNALFIGGLVIFLAVIFRKQIGF